MSGLLRRRLAFMSSGGFRNDIALIPRLCSTPLWSESSYCTSSLSQLIVAPIYYNKEPTNELIPEMVGAWLAYGLSASASIMPGSSGFTKPFTVSSSALGTPTAKSWSRKWHPGAKSSSSSLCFPSSARLPPLLVLWSQVPLLMPLPPEIIRHRFISCLGWVWPVWQVWPGLSTWRGAVWSRQDFWKGRRRLGRNWQVKSLALVVELVYRCKLTLIVVLHSPKFFIWTQMY